MFHTTPLAAITAALAIVSDPTRWTRHTAARRTDGQSVPSYHRDATCFCASGALRRAVIQPDTYSFATDSVDYNTEVKVSGLLDAEVRRRYPGRFDDDDVALYVGVNDDPQLGREAIVEIFRAVQAQLERQRVVETLISARALIADPTRWTRYRLARTDTGKPVEVANPAACRFCAVGAIARVTGRRPVSGDESYHLSRAAHRLFGQDIVNVNDILGHAEVLRVYDEAIASAKSGSLRS